MDTTSPDETCVPRERLVPSTRLSVYIMLCLTSMLHYAIRLSMNMNIVCMVVPTQIQDANNHNNNNNSSNNTNTNGLVSNGKFQLENITLEQPMCGYSVQEKRAFGYEGEFYWSRSQVGYLLSAYFYGYIPMQLLSGWMADKFGFRHVLGIGTLIGGILSLLMPVAARLHYGLLFAVRFLMGFVMGVMFPCCHACIGKWVPPAERITFLGVLFTGPSIGTMLAFVLSGYLCQFSWTLVFYILGAVSILWYAAFWYIIYNSPDHHPRISDTERHYINQCNNLAEHVSKRSSHVPWKSILTSRSVLGACVTHFSFVWVLYTVAAGIPLYMQDVLYFNIKDNGLLSSIPSLLQLCTCAAIGIFSDYVHRTVIESKHLLRKLSHTIFTFGVGISIVVVSVLTCEERKQAVATFCLTKFFINFIRGGLSLTASDIAPKFAGSVFGFINFVANFAGFLVPTMIGNLTPNGSQSEWQRVFLISGALVATGWLVFVFCVSHKEEPWAREPEEGLVEEVTHENFNMKPLTRKQVLGKQNSTPIVKVNGKCENL